MALIELDEVVIPRRGRRQPVRMATADEDITGAPAANVSADTMPQAPEPEVTPNETADMLGTPTTRGAPPPVAPRVGADTEVGAPSTPPEPATAADRDVTANSGAYPFVRPGYTGTEDTSPNDNAADTRSPSPAGTLVSRRLDPAEAAAGGPAHVPTASPAAPENDKRHQAEARPRTDADILEEAQRGRRRRTGARVGLGILGGIMQGAGVMTGIPGLAMMGSIMGAGGRAIDPNVPMQDAEAELGVRRHAAEAERQASQDAARAEQADFERGQSIRRGKQEDRRAATNEAMADTTMQSNIARVARDGREETRLHAADSPQAEAARGRWADARDVYLRTVPGATVEDLNDVEPLIGQLGAAEIEPAIKDLQRRIDSRSRRAGRGGGGSPRESAEARAARLAGIRTALIAQGVPEAQVNGMSADDLEAANRTNVVNQAANHLRDVDRTGTPGQVDPRQLAAYERVRGPIYVRESNLTQLRRGLQALQSENPALFAAAMSDVSALNNANSEAVVQRNRINRMVAAYLNKISGAGVSEGEFERTMRNTGAHNVIRPEALFGFIGDQLTELSNTRTSLDSGSPAAAAAWQRNMAERVRAQRAAARGGAQ